MGVTLSMLVLLMALGCCLADEEQRTLWIEDDTNVTASAFDSTIRNSNNNSNRTLVLQLFHKDSMASPIRRKHVNKVLLLAESLNADKERMWAMKQHRALSSKNSSASAQLIQISNPMHVLFGGGQYMTRIGVGTPPRIGTFLVDTGSQLTWLQCLPCSSTCVRSPIFDPSHSSSFRNVPCAAPICSNPRSATFCGPVNQCSYSHYYGKGNAYTKGNLAREVLTLSNWRIGNAAIGCTHDQSGNMDYGILGLSFGPLSFPNQISQLISGKFSYCLSESTTTRLIFGDGSVPPAPTPTIFTSILRKPDDNLYYVDLARVVIGARPVLVPQEETVEVYGTIIDSGATQTYLVQPAYNIIRDIFRAQALDLGPLVPPPEAFADNLDTCYNLFGRASYKVPSIDFYFRDGARLSLPAKNVLRRVPSRFNTAIYCLTFSPSFSDFNIIGNQHQRGFRVSYDMPNNRLGFTPAQCN